MTNKGFDWTTVLLHPETWVVAIPVIAIATFAIMLGFAVAKAGASLIRERRERPRFPTARIV